MTVSFTQIAVFLLALWLVIWSQTTVSTTFSAIMGGVAAVLVLLDVVWRRGRALS
jgi:ABC-type enterobactin transport system permease subunit